MDKMSLILLFMPLLFLFLLPLLRAECPNMRDIPTMWPNDTELPNEFDGVPNPMYYDGNFTCAQYWEGPGGQYPIDSCNGNFWIIPDKYDFLHHFGENKTCMGSIFVMPGCTLYKFPDNGDVTLGSPTYVKFRIRQNEFKLCLNVVNLVQLSKVCTTLITIQIVIIRTVVDVIKSL